MIKPFFVLALLLVLSISMMMVHYLVYDDVTPQKTLQHISKLTNIVSPSLSVAYYEPRILFYEEAVNPAYPQMLPIDKMDLVYAK